MITGKALYSISYYKPEKLVRLTWLSGSADMTDQDFKGALEVFAEGALQHHARLLMIDVTEFKHRPSPEVLAWRDQTIVPKYNRAGVKKVAWVWPGKHGTMATAEGEQYTNSYFSSEDEALAWIVA